MHLTILRTSLGTQSLSSSRLASMTLSPSSSSSIKLRMAWMVSPMTYFLKEEILMKQMQVDIWYFSRISRVASSLLLMGLI